MSTVANSKKLSTHIRWCIRRDMADVLRIESAVFEFPWPEDEFIHHLRQRNCIAMVAENNDRVVGFVVYELHASRLHILNFAVHPGFQRRGVGTAMLNKLVSKLSRERRNRIVLEVRESNLDAQLFFRASGFRCVSVCRGFYDDWTNEDAYLFQYRHGTTVRISE